MTNYCLPDGYQSRPAPQYFNDILDNATLWQADVYRAAVLLAERSGVQRIVDIGCGRATKLFLYAGEFDVVGIDYGANIQQLKETAPQHEWHEINLETEIVPAEIFQDSVVICADVIEHLIAPDNLIQNLRNAVVGATFVLVSTPDRERMYSAGAAEKSGPPSNPAHVREWTLQELAMWFESEQLPIAWGGWTVSFDGQRDRLNTCLLVLSDVFNRIELPLVYEPALSWLHWKAPTVKESGWTITEQLVEPPPRSDLLTVWMTPTPSEAARDLTNAINQIVVQVNKYLPEFGVQLVEHPQNAAIYAGHAGQGSQAPIHVAHFHGLYPTAQGSDNFAINREVIKNLKTAHVITAPSEWIADVIRRDMHIEPRVIGWGVDSEEWVPRDERANYVIWNKARVDNVSNPAPMLALAARAHDVLFLTTFGTGTPNVKTVGRQPYEVMKNYVRNAAVYLSTNVETFGIGLMEAMAAGVPVLSFRQGAQADYIEHGIHGFLAEPGDMEGLYQGLVYCLKHRERLGRNAREQAKHYTWQLVAEKFAAIYYEVAEQLRDVRPHRIDPNQYQE